MTPFMEGEGEIKASIKVWISALASLTYCYYISYNIPPGKFRFISLLPVFYILAVFPLTLSSISIGALSTFFLTWLANFKLIQFSFGQGPLTDNPSISLTNFISLACFPLNVKPPPPHTTNSEAQSPQKSKRSLKSFLNVGTKVILLVLGTFMFKYKNQLHPRIMTAYYIVHLYLSLELNLVLVAALAGALLGLEFEPQFNEPYLSTSLQEFWGKRWNLVATTSLRPVVYQPVRSITMKTLGKRRIATLLGMLSTFVVSGLIHELIFYQLVREAPTWEITWFFVLQGLLVVFESEIKRVLKVKLHPVLCWAYTLGILMATGDLFFFSPILRSNVDVIATRELIAVRDFFKSIGSSS